MINLQAKYGERLKDFTKKEILLLLNSALKYWEAGVSETNILNEDLYNLGLCHYFINDYFHKYEAQYIALTKEFMDRFIAPHAEGRKYMILSEGTKSYNAFYYERSVKGHLKRIETLKKAIASAELMPEAIEESTKKTTLTDLVLVALIFLGAATIITLTVINLMTN